MNPLTYHRIEKLTLEIRQRQDEIQRLLLRLLNTEIDEQTKTSVVDVISAVATAFECQISHILSNSHLADHAKPRHVAMWICVKLWYECSGKRMSKTEIAQQFGRTHSAVLHGVRSVDDRRATEPAFKQQTDELLILCSNVRDPKQLTLFKAA